MVSQLFSVEARVTLYRITVRVTLISPTQLLDMPTLTLMQFDLPSVSITLILVCSSSHVGVIHGIIHYKAISRI